MKIWIGRHKYTLTAVALLIAAIVLLTIIPYHAPRTVWFWQHPWWWYLIWFGGIATFGSANRRRKARRRQQNNMFPGGLPCPPECRIRVPHTHNKTGQ